MNAGTRKPTDKPTRNRAMVSYNASIGAGVTAISGGVFIIGGLGAALIAFGAVVILLSVYSAERLNRRSPRVLDRTADT